MHTLYEMGMQVPYCFTPKRCRKKYFFRYYKSIVEIYISLPVQTEEIKHRRGVENYLVFWSIWCEIYLVNGMAVNI
jgi:hypothetical protein